MSIFLTKIFSSGLEDTGAAGAHFFFPGLSKIFPNLTGYNSFTNGLMGVGYLIKEMIDEHRKSFKAGISRNDFIDKYLQQVHDTLDHHSSFFGETGGTYVLAIIFKFYLVIHYK